MSGLGWQDGAAIAITLGALGYLVARKLRPRKNASACGDCPGCAPGAATPSPNETLISIGEATPPRR